MIKNLLYFVLFVFLTGCDAVPTLDDVLPDRRTEYRKSEALPDLEVPPDLTTEALEDPMVIPDEQITTLSEFEQQRALRDGTIPGTNLPLTGGTDQEQWITLPGNNEEIWPKLREFWKDKAYEIDLDDAELGVLETLWLESNDGDRITRNRYKIYAEPSQNTGNTVLFISSEREEQSAGSEWNPIDRDITSEKEIVAELNLLFYGTVTPQASSSQLTRTNQSLPQKKLAKIENLDEEKIYLSLPDEFSLAWSVTEDALKEAGIFIEDQEQEKGLYHIIYYPAVEEDEGLLDKLKFWGDDEEEGVKYQISLTGVGEKTELVVLNEKGDWLEQETASRLLTELQLHYNRVNR